MPEAKRIHPKAAFLRGSLTAIFTPFDAAGNLTLEQMPLLLEFQRQAGMDGVVVCGTNGEGTSLSVAERKKVLEAVMEARGGLTIIAGTGAANLPDTLELTRHAAEMGVDGALVLPPFFFKNPSPEGLEAYFRPVLDASDLPILLYSIPQMTAVPIPDPLIDLLWDHPNFVGLKDSSGDWERTHYLITHYSDLLIFPGSDYLAGSGYAAGSVGCISGGANAFPEVVAAVSIAHRSDPTGESRDAAQERLTACTDILRRYPFISVSKAVLAHRGLSRLGVRPPLMSLPPEMETILLAELRSAGFLAE